MRRSYDALVGAVSPGTNGRISMVCVGRELGRAGIKPVSRKE